MKAVIKGFDYRFKDTRDAYLLITVDKRCLADMPDIKKPMEITIKAKRKQRSLSANAYCWVLCGKVAAKSEMGCGVWTSTAQPFRGRQMIRCGSPPASPEGEQAS